MQSIPAYSNNRDNVGYNISIFGPVPRHTLGAWWELHKEYEGSIWWLRKRSSRTKRNLKEEASFYFYVKAINSVKQQEQKSQKEGWSLANATANLWDHVGTSLGWRNIWTWELSEQNGWFISPFMYICNPRVSKISGIHIAYSSGYFSNNLQTPYFC